MDRISITLPTSIFAGMFVSKRAVIFNRTENWAEHPHDASLGLYEPKSVLSSLFLFVFGLFILCFLQREVELKAGKKKAIALANAMPIAR